jgi:hypothetical protein
MTGGFLAFAFGAVLLIAAIRHQSVGEVLSGTLAPNEPQTPKDDAQLQADLNRALGGATTAAAGAGQAIANAAGGDASALFAPGGGWGGSQAVVNIAIKIGKKHGLHVTSTKRATRSTSSGGVSDHWIGSKNAYAADQSNGSSPTPQMDATAKEIAVAFGLSWSGSGLVNGTFTDPQKRKFRVQMIYRSNIGGNHFNHVHFGARRI